MVCASKCHGKQGLKIGQINGKKTIDNITISSNNARVY